MSVETSGQILVMFENLRDQWAKTDHFTEGLMPVNALSATINGARAILDAEGTPNPPGSAEATGGTA